MLAFRERLTILVSTGKAKEAIGILIESFQSGVSDESAWHDCKD